MRKSNLFVLVLLLIILGISTGLIGITFDLSNLTNFINIIIGGILGQFCVGVDGEDNST